MIPFEAVRFAMLGSAVAEMQHEQQQEYIGQLEHHAGEMGGRVQSIQAEYQQLQEAYNDLLDYTHSIENERDDLQNKLQMLADQFDFAMARVNELQSQFQSLESNAGNIIRAEVKKLEAYPRMKKLLQTLFANAELALTENVTTEQRKKIQEFLSGLP